MQERKSRLESTRREYAKATEELETLKTEVVKAIRGESAFDKETLSSLIRETEARCIDLKGMHQKAQIAYDEGKIVMESRNSQYDTVIGWSELYEEANIETKKIIASCLIKRIDVYRGYRLHIDFNIDFAQFKLGLDCITGQEVEKKPV